MQKIETCLLGYRAMTIFLIFLLGEVLSSTQEVLHRREKRGTRAYKSVCVEKPSGRIYTAGDTWMRPAGRRVEFCRCEEGRRRCHSVPFIECAETKCYNGGRCLQALYSPNYLCKCLSRFTGEHCEIDNLASCYEGSGQSYRGNYSRTNSGAVCVNWNTQALNQKMYHAQCRDAQQLGLGNHNYCRNPDNDVRPWCHVMNGTETSWELCKVPQCTNCGIRQPQLNSRFRIAAGRIAHITSHPWMAAIFRVSRGTEYFRCGGTLISPCWVVTAAHCFYEESFPNRLRVKLGRTLQIVPGKEEQSFTVERLYIHPQFNDSNFDNDIALLNLKSSSESCAMDTDSARPACMPVRDQTLPDWTECEISGFGKHTRNSPFHSKQLKDGRVRLYPAKLCTSKQLANRTVTANMLCAGDPVNQDDACQGDSGGPLVCPINGLMHLLGVISWGEDCGVKDKPGVYTRVTRYIDWIQQKTGIQLN
ncbi:tissue-type plasminogen activator isoform X2 [Rhinoderma darwinii]|uniref:tissue-type plasminogen activator isoform X2 n=1 Tax=Rhinoderma darwinii TaxID=43563 RepID=UPI003F6690A9